MTNHKKKEMVNAFQEKFSKKLQELNLNFNKVNL
ncbi:ribonuclease III, partial [Staphylococcus sp. SNAZ 36]